MASFDSFLRSLIRMASLASAPALMLALGAGLPITAQAAAPDLVIEKSADDNLVHAGDCLFYDITVRNQGNANATGVAVVDTLPSEVRLLASTLPCDQGVTTQFEDFQVDTSADEIDSASANDFPNLVDGAPYRVTPKSDGSLPNGLFENTTYWVEVLNAADSRFAFHDSSALNSQINLTSQGSGIYTLTPLTISCDVGDLAINETVQFSLKVRVDPSAVVNEPFGTTTMTNTAMVTGNEADGNNSNNDASVTTFVDDLVDLRITKTVLPEGEIRAGDIIDYTILVDKFGPSTARNVVIRDTVLLDAEKDFAVLSISCLGQPGCAVDIVFPAPPLTIRTVPCWRPACQCCLRSRPRRPADSSSSQP